MIIVHIEEAFHPSYGYQVQNFCRHHSSVHEIHVVTGDTLRSRIVTESKTVLQSLDANFTKETNAVIHRLPVSMQFKQKTWLRGLHEKLSNINPDVIFCHGVEYLSLPRLLSKGWYEKCVVVTDSHDLPTAGYNKLLRFLYRLFVQNKCIKRINNRGITCFYTSIATLDSLAIYQIRKDLLMELPIGTCMKTFYKDTMNGISLRESIGINKDDILLLYTGKHDWDKTPHLLYEAALNLKVNPGVRLCILSVGARDDDYFTQKCSSIIQQLRSRGNIVEIRNAVPSAELKNYYSAADIGVFPCKNTLSTLDALACGLPTVMQEDVTNTDRLREGGLTFPLGDVSALTCAIQSLIDDPSLRLKKSVDGIKDMKSRFDYAVIVSKLETFLLSKMI